MGDAHGNADEAGDRGRLVNWGELLATCVASALATLVLSRLGVAGTIVGAAVTPFIITLTTTALSNEASRARRLARGDGHRPSLGPEGRRRLTTALATAAAATCVLVVGITFAEAVSDERVSDWGRDGAGSSSGEQAPAQESPTPTETPPGSRDPSPTPTASTPTPTPTATATPTAPATPSPTPTASPSPAAEP